MTANNVQRMRLISQNNKALSTYTHVGYGQFKSDIDANLNVKQVSSTGYVPPSGLKRKFV